MNRKITKSLLMERAGLLNEVNEADYKPGTIAPKDLYYSDKHGKLVAMDDVDDKYHDRLELVYKKGDRIEDPMNENKHKPHKSNKMNRKVTKRLLMERAGLLNEDADIYDAVIHAAADAVKKKHNLSDEEVQSKVFRGTNRALHSEVMNLAFKGIIDRLGVDNVDFSDFAQWFEDTAGFLHDYDAEKMDARIASMNEMNEMDEMDEGEMVTDEGSTSNEIKDFMEAHCTVDELDQMYEYLQEMMKRVAETAKEDGKRYAKLAKKMARK
jgi:hypothetical protein